MPRATLSFKIPDEADDFRSAQDGPALQAAAWNYDQWLRNKVKYGETPEEKRAIYQECRDQFNEEFQGLYGD